MSASATPNIMQVLSDARINPFGVMLVAESLLKSPLAPELREAGRPLVFFLPIERGDCAGWAGVRFTLEPLAKEPT